MKRLVKLLILMGVAAALQYAARMSAVAERGSSAMGGEMLVFPLVMIIGGSILGLFGRDCETEEIEEDDDDYDDIEVEIEDLI